MVINWGLEAKGFIQWLIHWRSVHSWSSIVKIFMSFLHVRVAKSTSMFCFTNIALPYFSWGLSNTILIPWIFGLWLVGPLWVSCKVKLSQSLLLHRSPNKISLFTKVPLYSTRLSGEMVLIKTVLKTLGGVILALSLDYGEPMVKN